MKSLIATVALLLLTLNGLAAEVQPPPSPPVGWLFSEADLVFAKNDGWHWLDSGAHADGEAIHTWVITSPALPEIQFILVADKTGGIKSLSAMVVGPAGSKPEDWMANSRTVMLFFYGFSGIEQARLERWSDEVMLDELLALENGKYSNDSAYEKYGWRVASASWSGVTEDPTIQFFLYKTDEFD